MMHVWLLNDVPIFIFTHSVVEGHLTSALPQLSVYLSVSLSLLALATFKK